jgi:predicted MFS family arabinose efflux permease
MSSFAPLRGLGVALAGAAATCSGIGLARFAYVPLFPAMVAAGWVDGAGAGLLGAVNLGGYLLGVLAGRGLARRIGVPRALDLGMAAALLAFLACAWEGGLAWLAAWRGLAGAAGGLLMALAGPSVQAVVDPRRRGLAGGVVIGGVGAGIVLGALLVPALLPQGVAAAWLGLAVLVLLLWLASRPSWPAPLPAPPATSAVAHAPRAPGLVLAYALHAAGMVAPMVYLADLAARGRGLGLGAGATTWLLFGLGALSATLLAGRAADRLGGRRALVAVLLVQVLALGLALLPGRPALVAAALLAGGAALGTTTVVLAAARERAGAEAATIWVQATAAFAVTQAASAFAAAALFAATGESHAAVFGACLAMSVAALAVALADLPRRARG